MGMTHFGPDPSAPPWLVWMIVALIVLPPIAVGLSLRVLDRRREGKKRPNATTSWTGVVRRIAAVALFVAAVVAGVADRWAATIALVVAAFLLAPLTWFRGIVQPGDSDSAGPAL